jgi:hypothetical protein
MTPWAEFVTTSGLFGSWNGDAMSGVEMKLFVAADLKERISCRDTPSVRARRSLNG